MSVAQLSPAPSSVLSHIHNSVVKPRTTTEPQQNQPFISSIWNVPPPPLIVEAEAYEIGEVDNYLPGRGFGFIEYAGGSLFFHAAGFRMPRMMPTYRNNVLCSEIQLALIRTRQEDEEKQRRKAAGEKATQIPLPPIHKGLGMMFQIGDSKNGKQATRWCIQEDYNNLLDQNRHRYEQEYANWKRLGRYKLELCELRQLGTYRANNHTKSYIPEVQAVRTTLFEGTNTDFLKEWFKSCVADYKLCDTRYVELQFQVHVEESNTYTAWEACDQETMHDFLGQ